ncbi:MAG: 1-(5-phosphoribosyl)-5-[(5-phosphoribosylamino)methylideneamino]imidazole-4-carboxamide isomerase [Planctomycetaceae bacterium]
MQIWPAIDLRGGKCVRLRQGDYARETVYGDPAEMAKRWLDKGADCLHLVDLDGARDGNNANLEAVKAILAVAKVPCQLGGGVRDEARIQMLLDLGLSRLVVGTKALKEPDWFREMCRKFPGKLALGIDARDGMVATDGWLETSKTDAVSMAKDFEGEPLAAIIYTDISRDGMLSGPNVPAMEQMQKAVKIPVLASGGVAVVGDIVALKKAGMPGAIVGRSLYEGTLTLEDALLAARS